MRVPSRNGTPAPACAGPGCEAPVPLATGRPGRFCSGPCRSRARQRQRHDDVPVVVEVDFGSASSRGRSPERAWLPRHGADRLAEQITGLLDGDAGPGA